MSSGTLLPNWFWQRVRGGIVGPAPPGAGPGGRRCPGRRRLAPGRGVCRWRSAGPGPGGSGWPRSSTSNRPAPARCRRRQVLGGASGTGASEAGRCASIKTGSSAARIIGPNQAMSVGSSVRSVAMISSSSLVTFSALQHRPNPPPRVGISRESGPVLFRTSPGPFSFSATRACVAAARSRTASAAGHQGWQCHLLPLWHRFSRRSSRTPRLHTQRNCLEIDRLATPWGGARKDLLGGGEIEAGVHVEAEATVRVDM